jgi:L-aspartate oxidase
LTVEPAVADVVIVGGGLAGLYGVLHLPREWEVIVVDKASSSSSGSSPLAQGGMAVAVGPDDSPDLHARDTIRAGAHACAHAAVELLAHRAPDELATLRQLGCRFDQVEDGSLHLNLEGGQSVARSVHAADATGREIMRVVLERARDRATRMVGCVTRLLSDNDRCVGVVVSRPDGPAVVLARAVLLAAGGCGALFEATTNVAASTGDGVALAFEAGAAVSDLELVQFHPTVLASGGHQRVLLTEALRGDGAIVVDDKGRRFLFDAHPKGELAPRDVVARAVAARGGAWLDARPLGGDRIREHFPNVYDAALSAGFDLTAEPVPVMPAAHYMLGGVATDLDGRTSIPGLFAAGECAATGVHGANRMAGNSLAEAVVFGRLAALAAVAEDLPRPARVSVPAPVPAEGDDPSSSWQRLRSALSRGAGLVRSVESLEETWRVAAEIAEEARGDELRLAATTASLICRSALARDESRGVHYRADAPAPEESWNGAHVTLRK